MVVLEQYNTCVNLYQNMDKDKYENEYEKEEEEETVKCEENEENNESNVDENNSNNDYDSNNEENENDVESSDESMESSDEDTEKLEELILKKLLKLKSYKKEKKKKDQKYIPFLKNFLAKDMQTRFKTINDKHINDLMYLNNTILNKKIDINLKDFELDRLHYVAHDVHPRDKKLVFAEDYNLHIIYKKALRVLEQELKGQKRQENRKKK